MGGSTIEHAARAPLRTDAARASRDAAESTWFSGCSGGSLTHTHKKSESPVSLSGRSTLFRAVYAASGSGSQKARTTPAAVRLFRRAGGEDQVRKRFSRRRGDSALLPSARRLAGRPARTAAALPQTESSRGPRWPRRERPSETNRISGESRKSFFSSEEAYDGGRNGGGGDGVVVRRSLPACAAYTVARRPCVAVALRSRMRAGGGVIIIKKKASDLHTTAQKARRHKRFILGHSGPPVRSLARSPPMVIPALCPDALFSNLFPVHRDTHAARHSTRCTLRGRMCDEEEKRKAPLS
ncbi:hypothetical protein HPB50_023403 [Hyalomma asiaticum]|uniref:Uncharacterized protein n=1 Tax=Hyalomma asiaticum TaxID=266040 RepID=A0ACB7S3P1_HYAAI|nr:hypothetical protein HPB50_023403 [Hyalomma asiaticum]